MHHHGRAVAVAEIDDLDGHTLIAQRHRQRREHEGGGQVLRDD